MLLAAAPSVGESGRNIVPRVNSFTASPSSAYTTLPVTFTANVSDPLGYGLRWEWDFEGDGIVDRTYTTDPTLPGEPVVRQETLLYTAAATYRSRLTVTNLPPPGQTSRSVVVSIVVVIDLNHAPVLTPVDVVPSDDTAPAGQAFVFSSSATDMDGDACAYRWEFGDGGNLSGSLPGTTDPQVLGASYAYAFEGDYLVTLTLDDGKGGVASSAVLVTVLPLPSIEVEVQAPWDAIAPGETMQVTVTARSGGQPLPGASVLLASEPGATLNPTSGTTNASGVFTSLLTADTSGFMSSVTVTANVTKPGYTPGSGSFSVWVTPFPYSFTVLSNRREMMSNETAIFHARLTKGSVGITGASVTASTPVGGTFSPVTDLGNGNYTFEWTAPRVVVQTFAAINVIAHIGGYYDFAVRIVLLIDPNRTNPTDPTQLFLLVRADALSVRPGGTVNFTLYAYTGEGFVVSGATVAVYIPSFLGTVTAVVDRLNGVYTFTFTASSNVTDKWFLMSIQVGKYGYASAQVRTAILITG